jgi:hypothetical protein
VRQGGRSLIDTHQRDMRAYIQDALVELPRIVRNLNGAPVVVEHGYEAELISHELLLRLCPDKTLRLVVVHPDACGCNAITEELVLHG